MKKVFFCFLIFCLVVNIISCGQTTEENVNYAVSKANNTVTDTASSIDNSLFGEDSDTDVFKIFPEEGASVWEFVRTKSGYALVGSKNRRPCFQIIDLYGKNDPYINYHYALFLEEEGNLAKAKELIENAYSLYENADKEMKLAQDIWKKYAQYQTVQ